MASNQIQSNASSPLERLLSSSIHFANARSSIEWFCQGYAASQRGDYKAAIRNYEYSLHMNPQCNSSRYNAGISAWKMGDLPLAKQWFRDQLKVSRKHSRACMMLGIICFLQGKTHTGVRLLEKSRTLDSTNNLVAYNLHKARIALSNSAKRD